MAPHRRVPSRSPYCTVSMMGEVWETFVEAAVTVTV